MLTASLGCEAREAGRFLASIAQYHAGTARPLAFLAGGETVVHVTGRGRGGRNQELALAAAEGIAGMQNAVVFSVGSDGTDGPTDAAGGLVDGATCARLAAQGVSGWEKACAQACQSANRLLRGWENLSLVLGGESPRLEPLSLWEEAESLLEAARLAVPPPRLRLEWRFPREETVVMADRRWLERVLCNLLSNGCLFGGGELSVRGKKTGGQGMVTVRDRGPGLPPGLEQGEPPAPGEMFCREGLPRSGAGFGLCACRRAVGVLGGRFLLSSGKEGAAVSFSLPLDPAGRRPEPPPAPADYLHSRLSPLMVGLSDLLSPL